MPARPSIAEVRAQLAAASGRQLARLLEQHGDDDRAGVQTLCEVASRRLAAQRAETARIRRLYRLEAELRQQGASVVAGVDEVGRGALAGPLTAAAVVLPEHPRIDGLDDSKALTPEQREDLDVRIRHVAIAVSIAHVGSDVLDGAGMTPALRRAMLDALAGLDLEPDAVLVDGLPMRVHPREHAVVKGDSKVAAIAAASIVAKVARDALMREAGVTYPQYGFGLHKGYSTPEHLAAIDEHGLTPLHRRSFAPCARTMRLF